jgi:DTW domain-containing protein YfiP
MLMLNPLLQALPRWSLAPPAASRYLIRRAEHPHQRSTLEAACQALQVIERAPQRYIGLLQAFDGFVAQQQQLAEAGRRLRSAQVDGRAGAS